MSDLVQGIAPEQRGGLLAVNEQLVLAMLQATVDAEQSAERLSEATRSAHLDPLTGLPDRVVFLDRFTQAITQARRHGSRLGVLFVDLDRFKEINDTLGHGVGDRILCASARALASTVREADTVSRHGGDEFLVLLTEISDASGAEVIARKLCDAISGSSEIAALGVRLTASIGVSVYPNDGQDARTLIDRADAAMYRVKKARIGVATASLVAERPLRREEAETAAVVAERTQHPRAASPGDELHRLLREANERLLIAALDAHSSEKGSASAPAYRALIDHMEDGAISVDGDGRLLLCNRRFAGLIDVDRGKLVGTPFARMLANDDEAQAFRRMLVRGSVDSASGNFTLVKADGSGVPVNITLVDEQPLVSDSPLRVVSGIVTDLREQGAYGHAGAALASRLHRAVIERGRAERRLEATLDAAGMGGLEVDLDSGVLGWIRRHDRFFGGAEVKHVTLSDLFAQVVPEDRALVERAFANAATSGVIDVEHRIVRADTGALCWIHIKATVRDGPGRGQAVGVVTDVTERHALANQLRQVLKMEAVGQLTSGIAHDFNNLLAIIGGSIDLVTRRIAADESTRRPLEAAREAVVRGAKLNRQLMDFARPRDRDAERLRLDDLLPGLKELAEWTGAGAVAVRVTRTPDAWPCLVDRRDLEVAFVNLAVNAAAAMPDGGTLTLSVVNVVADAAMASAWRTTPGDYTALVVEDTGSGMTPEVLARAFEPFFTTKAPGVGTGLGLAQVHQFAKQSGGFCTIESEPARGTRTAIHLPRVA